jgi:hypothetical protein
MMFNRGLVAALLLFAACQMETETDPSTLTHTLSWHQPPAMEVDDCHVFKLDNPTPVEIDRITVNFPPGSHHVHIYRSDTPDPDRVYDCWSGLDWNRWHLVLGVQTEEMDWELPDQLTIPFDAHQQLLVQVHWINTSSDPIDREIDLKFHMAETSRAHVGTVFGVNKQTAMDPHSSKVLSKWCPVPQGSSLLAMMGHYHGLGTKYVVTSRKEPDATGEIIYNALDEQTFEFETYEPGYVVPQDHGLEFECTFNNTRDIPITWGADTRLSEHCNMSAYYYPAPDDGLSLFCTVEMAEVRSIVAPKARIATGTSPVYTVNFTEATAQDEVMQLASSNTAALTVPATVAVPKGATSVTFQAQALKTTVATITATLGTTSKSITTAIGGVALSEVFLDAADTSAQWVEISNLSDEPIDLSGYSLGAGQSNYMTTQVPLTFTLPARGCAVVGGSALGSQPWLAQVSDFAPSLGPAATGITYGIALFDVKADQMTGQTLPFDTLVYGTTSENNTLIAPSGLMAPVFMTPPGDSSFTRSAESTWKVQAAPSPGICEVR